MLWCREDELDTNAREGNSASSCMSQQPAASSSTAPHLSRQRSQSTASAHLLSIPTCGFPQRGDPDSLSTALRLPGSDVLSRELGAQILHGRWGRSGRSHATSMVSSSSSASPPSLPLLPASMPLPLNASATCDTAAISPLERHGRCGGDDDASRTAGGGEGDGDGADDWSDGDDDGDVAILIDRVGGVRRGLDSLSERLSTGTATLSATGTKSPSRRVHPEPSPQMELSRARSARRIMSLPASVAESDVPSNAHSVLRAPQGAFTQVLAPMVLPACIAPAVLCPCCEVGASAVRRAYSEPAAPHTPAVIVPPLRTPRPIDAAAHAATPAMKDEHGRCVCQTGSSPHCREQHAATLTSAASSAGAWRDGLVWSARRHALTTGTNAATLVSGGHHGGASQIAASSAARVGQAATTGVCPVCVANCNLCSQQGTLARQERPRGEKRRRRCHHPLVAASHSWA